MSEKNKNKSSKKWLLSRLKISGSLRRYQYRPSYADSRSSKKASRLQDLPQRESMSKQSGLLYKINTKQLQRFLYTQVGKHWDEVYAAITERIPTQLLPYKDECIGYYVADLVAFQEDGLWDLRKHYYIAINTEEVFQWSNQRSWMEFYVDPDSRKLVRIGDFKSRKQTRDLDKDALRLFREKEQQEKQQRRLHAKQKKAEDISKVTELLRQDQNRRRRTLYYHE